MTASEAAPCIRVRNVTHRYRRAERDALHDVSLDIERGSIFGLLGPNGAGKSSLLGLLSGSLRLQLGEISIDGYRLQDGHHLKQISALVPQEYAFYEDLTGRENLAYFAGTYGLSGPRATRRIEACAQVCRLTEVLKQRAGEYSGGLKRRLNLAIGLLNEPRILYLDEPTVGIDAESRQYIVDAIKDLHRGGVTIVYTSHYMEEVEQLCDTIAVIDRGRLVLQGGMDALLRREGGSTLVIRLKEPVPKLFEPLSRYGAEHTGFLSWQLDAPSDRLGEILNVVNDAGAAVERAQYGVSRLEKVYLQVLANDEPLREAVR